MNNKKTLIILTLGLTFVAFLLHFVSAQSSFLSSAGDFYSKALDSIGNGLNPLFAEKEAATKTLLAILFFMVAYTTIDAFFKKKWYFTFIITGIVTVLSVWWLPPEFISTIRTQYGAMGVAILSIIPFMIMLVFTIRVESDLVGRVLWLFYAIYYFTLFIYTIATGSGSWLSAENIPYYGAIIAGIFLFFTMPAVRRAIFKGQLKEIREEGAKAALESKVLREIKKKELGSYLEK